MSAEMSACVSIPVCARVSENVSVRAVYYLFTTRSIFSRIATLVLIMLMACCDSLRRRVPLNFLALGLFVSGGAGDKFVTPQVDINGRLPPPSLSASPFRRWWRG